MHGASPIICVLKKYPRLDSKKQRGRNIPVILMTFKIKAAVGGCTGIWRMSRVHVMGHRAPRR